MSREISKAENWERVYEAYQNINFTAFDFDTVKESMIDYIKLYFPENFNDYIESSEFIAILELFAYVSELLAYRIDMNAHENFISVAARKQSVLRLAKLISYNPSRNIPARGLVKINSIQTTENVFDSRGKNLINQSIIWNDTNNANWKEQFLLVADKMMQQPFGTVSPNDRIQVEDVLFELYPLNNTPIQNGVIPYTASTAAGTFPMELVPVALTENGPEERRPEINASFTMLYGSDGLGDGSDTTGFFMLTKQGELQSSRQTYDGIIPNQTTDINISNINETDVWVNEVDPDTGETIKTTNIDPIKRNLGYQGEWEPVDLANTQNIIFNTNVRRNKYEVETLEDDQIRLIFGDGEFADIPKGSFDIWFRTSENDDVVISKNEIAGQTTSFTYLDNNNITQTITITYSLINSLTNNSASEDIENIRRIAPAVYYTQDRMVNAQDYNTYMLRDPSIIKLRTVNRTYAGDSKYIAWHDPSEHYENVKIFGDDLVTFFKEENLSVDITNANYNDPSLNRVILDYMQPLLSTPEIWVWHELHGLELPNREFKTAEITLIKAAMVDLAIGNVQPWIGVKLVGTTWEVDSAVAENSNDYTFLLSYANDTWTLTYKSGRMVVQSDTTKFWFNNEDGVITYDTLNTNYDQINILKANPKKDGTGVLDQSIVLNIIGRENAFGDDALSTIGLDDTHQLRVMTTDENGDRVPDDMILDGLMDTMDYVFYKRIPNTDGAWEYAFTDATAAALDSENYDPVIAAAITENGVIYDNIDVDYDWIRFHGRGELNFAWFHRTPRYDLIDPATSNIHDMYIITSGYYAAIKNWVNGISNEPDFPTPLQLKQSYGHLLDSKMLSDTVILHPGKIKILFGEHAQPALRGRFNVVRSSLQNLTDNEIKVRIVASIKEYFDINYWEFGETFNFTELAAFVHSQNPSEIDSFVLVPTYPENSFGDMFQILAAEDEILQPSITVNDIEIVNSLNAQNIRQLGS